MNLSLQLIFFPVDVQQFDVANLNRKIKIKNFKKNYKKNIVDTTIQSTLYNYYGRSVDFSVFFYFDVHENKTYKLNIYFIMKLLISRLTGIQTEIILK